MAIFNESATYAEGDTADFLMADESTTVTREFNGKGWKEIVVASSTGTAELVREIRIPRLKGGFQNYPFEVNSDGNKIASVKGDIWYSPLIHSTDGVSSVLEDGHSEYDADTTTAEIYTLIGHPLYNLATESGHHPQIVSIDNSYFLNAPYQKWGNATLGTPAHLTWSIVPTGISMPSMGDFRTFNDDYGTKYTNGFTDEAQISNLVSKALEEWSNVSGLTFEQVPFLEEEVYGTCGYRDDNNTFVEYTDGGNPRFTTARECSLIKDWAYELGQVDAGQIPSDPEYQSYAITSGQLAANPGYHPVDGIFIWDEVELPNKQGGSDLMIASDTISNYRGMGTFPQETSDSVPTASSYAYEPGRRDSGLLYVNTIDFPFLDADDVIVQSIDVHGDVSNLPYEPAPGAGYLVDPTPFGYIHGLLVHEIGHCLGMFHVPDALSVMGSSTLAYNAFQFYDNTTAPYPFYEELNYWWLVNTKDRTLSRGDTSGIQALYGLPQEPYKEKVEPNLALELSYNEFSGYRNYTAGTGIMLSDDGVFSKVRTTLTKREMRRGRIAEALVAELANIKLMLGSAIDPTPNADGSLSAIFDSYAPLDVNAFGYLTYKLEAAWVNVWGDFDQDSLIKNTDREHLEHYLTQGVWDNPTAYLFIDSLIDRMVDDGVFSDFEYSTVTVTDEETNEVKNLNFSLVGSTLSITTTL